MACEMQLLKTNSAIYLLLGLMSFLWTIQSSSQTEYGVHEGPLEEGAVPLPPVPMIEKKLIKTLLQDYDKRSRPVIDGQTPIFTRNTNPISNITQITIEFGLSLVQILDLNEMDQVLTTSVRSLYRWIDYHMTWTPKDYQNITFVMIPTDKLWLPDIALYNYADERLEERRTCDAKVYYNGTVEWNPMAIYKSTCKIQIKYFPFDKQRCHMKFGPWTYDGFRVNISYYNNNESLQMDDYVISPEWVILGHKGVYSEIKYPCCPEPYADISFFIWLERQPAFYAIILILPCFLLSSLTLVLFWLPAESPAKMVLGMNIFVAFFLLLLLLEDTTPSASNSFPMIGQYYCLNMGIITLSTFLSVIIVNFHFRGDSRKEVPYWLKKLAIHHGARILFVNVGPLPSQATTSKSVEASKKSNYSSGSGNPVMTHSDGGTPATLGYQYHQKQQQNHLQPQQQLRGGKRILIPQESSNNVATFDQRFDNSSNHCPWERLEEHCLEAKNAPNVDPRTQRRINMLAKDVQDILKSLRFIQRQNENRERVSKLVADWRHVALVMDRLFFFCYVLAMIISMILFFPKSGNEVTVGNHSQALDD